MENKNNLQIFKKSIINLISDLTIILIAYLFYTNQQYFKNSFDHYYIFEWFNDFQIQFTVFNQERCLDNTTCINITSIVIIGFLAVLIPFRLLEKDKENCKSRIFLSFFGKLFKNPNQILNISPEPKEKTAILAILVKVFYLPLMLNWLFGNGHNVFNNFKNAYHACWQLNENCNLVDSTFRVIFDAHFYWLAFYMIIFIDVLFYTFGYLFEFNFLNNKIRSVEPTLLGWLVALACYPPFNNVTNNFLEWYSNDMFQYQFAQLSGLFNDAINITMNLGILILMGIYSWASVALGAKASNLTNRGIVDGGPYAFVRHPAYICKCSAWVIGAIPALITGFFTSTLQLALVILSLSGIIFIYFLRAMTEERHLKMDPDYLKYCEKVHWKFIPKIW